MKQAFLINTADDFQAKVWEDNLAIIPTAATITIHKPNTNEELISAQAMTIDSVGLMSYDLTAVNNDTADANYKAVITYTYAGEVSSVTFFYDVVHSKLHIVITDEDVIGELPQLKDKGWRVHGTADSGSTTTIVDNALTRYDDDYFTGGLATSLTLQETQRITDFVKATGRVTTSEFGAAITTDKYMLQRSFGKEIRRGFDKIIDLLVREGHFPHLVLDSNDLRELHIMFATAEVCKGFMTEGDGLWWELWQDYKRTAFAMYKALNLKYDKSNDGYISGSEEHKRFKRTLGRG